MVSRVIFDTNIYGRVIEKSELDKLINDVQGCLLNYGSVVIKQELKAYEGKRTVPYEGKIRKFRALLLEAYELLVKKTYEIINELANLKMPKFRSYEQLKADLKLKRWSS